MLCQEPLSINVVSQNVLLDYTRAKKKIISHQNVRIPSLAATILGAFENKPLDVVAIQEAQGNEDFHNGKELAERCGYGPGFWELHNKKVHDKSRMGRKDEHVGLFGALIDDAEVIELGDNRKGLMTEIAGVAFLAVHLRHGPNPQQISSRAKAARRIVTALNDYDDAVVLGDFNEPDVHVPVLGQIAPARRTLTRHGFTSVFELTNQDAPLTCPTEPYLPLFRTMDDWRGKKLYRAWGLDDILIRGSRVRALSAGVVPRVIEYEGEPPHGVPLEGSDHDGIWAQLSVSIHD